MIGELAERFRPPAWVLAWGKAVAERIGTSTSRFRLGPDYIVIGGQRCGTTALNRYLWDHPNVIPAMYKEIHFFDLNHRKGLGWYRGHFPTARHQKRVASERGGVALTGEATPYYLFHPLVPERLLAAFPDVRLIAMLRDPVARAISHYHHERALGIETLGLRDALDAEDDRLAGEEARILRDATYTSRAHQHFSYKARGRYAEQLQRWLGRFPRDQLLIVEAGSFFMDPGRALALVTSFLGLPTISRTSYEPHNAQEYGSDDAAITILRDHFRPHNRRLYDLIGTNLGWDR